MSINRIRVIGQVDADTVVKVNELRDGSDRIFLLYRRASSLSVGDQVEPFSSFQRTGRRTIVRMVEGKARTVAAKTRERVQFDDDGPEADGTAPDALLLVREVDESEAASILGRPLPDRDPPSPRGRRV